jgi:dimethylargininase
LPTIALTRPVPASLANCQLTHLERTEIDLGLAREQHAAYEEALTALGCRVERVAAADDLPDCVFVEDTAVVVDEVAVMTRPGAPSRHPEIDAVALSLSPFRELRWLGEPAMLDGGDVLQLGRLLYVGTGGRSNDDGVEQLEKCLAAFGYEVRAVQTTGCLHLKSAVTLLTPELALINPAWVDPAVFEAVRVIEVDPSEPFAANVLRIGETVICAGAFPRTRARIEAAGLGTRTVDVSELAKAEGALTCCSLIFKA